jgi:3-hydroxybutyryl-CoA dehydrogenase
MSPSSPPLQRSSLPLQTIAIIGAGPAGRAFAMRCAMAGLRVVLEDVMPANLRRAQDEYTDLAATASAGTLSYALTVDEAVRDADIIVDFVPDELESKLEIFSMADRMAPPRSIFCTPTESLSITDLASCTYRADRCVALRGSMHTGPLQLVRSKYVSAEAIASVASLLEMIGIAATVEDDLAVVVAAAS